MMWGFMLMGVWGWLVVFERERRGVEWKREGVREMGGMVYVREGMVGRLGGEEEGKGGSGGVVMNVMVVKRG